MGRRVTTAYPDGGPRGPGVAAGGWSNLSLWEDTWRNSRAASADFAHAISRCFCGCVAAAVAHRARVCSGRSDGSGGLRHQLAFDTTECAVFGRRRNAAWITTAVGALPRKPVGGKSRRVRFVATRRAAKYAEAGEWRLPARTASRPNRHRGWNGSASRELRNANGAEPRGCAGFSWRNTSRRGAAPC